MALRLLNDKAPGSERPYLSKPLSLVAHWLRILDLVDVIIRPLTQ